MRTIHLGKVQFTLREDYNFTWLESWGEVFCVFDQNDSGNISFGVRRGDARYFLKIAGLKTMESVRTPEEAAAALKAAMPVYGAVKHPRLIELVWHGAAHGVYIAVFRWAEGECLFDYWNFEKYHENPRLTPPAKRFKGLPAEKRVKSVEVLFSFLAAAAKSGYVAVDFYDGSILYDFAADTTTICDIDFFRRKPAYNDMGVDYWGTKRLKAPEEYVLGAAIDEATNVYTLGALIFDFFGNYTEEDIQKRYQENAFSPCAFENWELGRPCYDAALRAVERQRACRYAAVAAFHTAWTAALREGGIQAGQSEGAGMFL